MPQIELLKCKEEFFLGSEITANRASLKKADDIVALFTGQNKAQLTRALLMDLAFLNSDRTHKNTLRDGNGLLWFVDHDKSLWGDGRLPSETPSGDLGRLNIQTIERKFRDYLGDYLAYREANTLVFTPKNRDFIVEQFRMLRLDLSHFVKAKERIPTRWLDEELFSKMSSFLPVWWKRLQGFIEAKDSIDQLIAILRDRQRLAPN